jgi:hypothetical protein
MSTFYKTMVFAASRDVSKTNIKLVNSKFGESTVWLNLRTPENKPDFGAQKVVAEILRGLVGSGKHIELTIHSDEIVQNDKGGYQVFVTAENLKSRLNLVVNAEPSETEDSARSIFSDLLSVVANKPEPTDEPVELF